MKNSKLEDMLGPDFARKLSIGLQLVNETGAERAPDFFCIGAEKCGTTWLWEMLDSHPDVGVPIPKELRYFSHLYLNTGFSNFSAIEQLLLNEEIPRNPRLFYKRLATEIRVLFGNDLAYKRIFGAMNELVVGDLSPQYCMLRGEELQHLASVSPSAKIIFLIRDPVTRLISAGKMKAGENERELTENSIRDVALSPFQRRMTNYATILSNYESVFPKSNIFVGFMDDIIERPLMFLESICEFLGVRFAAEYFEKSTHAFNEGLKYMASSALKDELFKIVEPEYLVLSERYPEKVNHWLRKYNYKS